LAARIELALDQGTFVLFAQLIQPLHSEGHRLHAEVLIRMVDGDGSLIPPGAFLPAAERFHLASRIDRWVLQQAIAWMQSVFSLDSIDCINLNLSGQSVGDRAFHRWAIEVLSGAGPRICSKLCFEITETAAVTNLVDAGIFIEQARAIGLRVALDDFGAGASWFGYLKKMPVDYLKIDGQFIRDLVNDSLHEAAVRCFADVARLAGMKTIAECVDDAEVLHRLKAMGIDFAQGFLLHKPVPLEQLGAQIFACH
jgi:EAL domain-containing protein (putative c-di-GMP-specific phosphodiesterase class I)